MILCPYTAGSDSQTVSGTSAEMSIEMTEGKFYLFVSDTACWIAQDDVPVASAADGSMYVPANTIIIIDGALGEKLAVIQASAGGTASLSPTKVF